MVGAGQFDGSAETASGWVARSLMADAWTKTEGAVLYAKADPPDFKQAFHFAELACNAGDAEGCGYLGDMYLMGAGVDKDVRAAEAALDKACAGKVTRACFNLATAYSNGTLPENTKKAAGNPKKAAALWKRACNAGSQVACRNLTELNGGTVM